MIGSLLNIYLKLPQVAFSVQWPKKRLSPRFQKNRNISKTKSNFEKPGKTTLDSMHTKVLTKFREAAMIVAASRQGRLMCREKEEKNPILEPKIADFDKSQKSNQTEFRDAVNGIVFIRSSSIQKHHCWSLQHQGSLCLRGAKSSYSRVRYIAPRSAAPKSFEIWRRGAAPAVAGAGC